MSVGSRKIGTDEREKGENGEISSVSCAYSCHKEATFVANENEAHIDNIAIFTHQNKKLLAYIDHLEAKAKTLTDNVTQLEKRAADAQDDLVIVRMKHEKCQRTQEELNTRIGELEISLEAKEHERAELEQVVEAVEDQQLTLNVQHNNLWTEVEEFKRNREEVQEYREEFKRLTEVEILFHCGKKEIERLAYDLDEAIQEIAVLRQEKDKSASMATYARAEIDRLEQKNGRLEEEIAKLEQNIRKNIDDLSHFENVGKRKDDEIADLGAVVEQKDVDISILKRDVVQKNDGLVSLANQIEGMREFMETITEYERGLEESDLERDDLKQRLTELQSEIGSLEVRIEETERERRNIHENLIHTQNELSDVREEKNKLEDRCRALELKGEELHSQAVSAERHKVVNQKSAKLIAVSYSEMKVHNEKLLAMNADVVKSLKETTARIYQVANEVGKKDDNTMTLLKYSGRLVEASKRWEHENEQVRREHERIVEETRQGDVARVLRSFENVPARSDRGQK